MGIGALTKFERCGGWWIALSTSDAVLAESASELSSSDVEAAEDIDLDTLESLKYDYCTRSWRPGTIRLDSPNVEIAGAVWQIRG